MPYPRAKSRSINQTVYYDNRLSSFVKQPMQIGNLAVEKDETVGGNMNVGGNLRIGGDLSATNFYANNGNFFLDNYILIPYGTIIQSAAINTPNGWLLCNGASILKSVYYNLYSAIGDTYGASGNYFNIPDIRGRVVVGSGTGVGLTTRNLGGTGGEERHTLTTGEMPSHSHSSNATGGSIGLITSTGNNTASSGLDSTSGEPDLYASLPALTINSTGGGNPHNVMQPFIVFNYFIKY